MPRRTKLWICPGPPEIRDRGWWNLSRSAPNRRHYLFLASPGHERCGHSGGLTPEDEAGRDTRLDEMKPTLKILLLLFLDNGRIKRRWLELPVWGKARFARFGSFDVLDKFWQQRQLKTHQARAQRRRRRRRNKLVARREREYECQSSVIAP